ncbi:MAG TPA: DNA internalization-related competence protein ComEC/Rec2, partial [Gammaproteobacteria bacterium]|nr:DNA internalization-related competence protein ComEC/Rec2 [Gammaproteobacteria bacterium]
TGYVRANSPWQHLESVWYSRPVDRLRTRLRRLIAGQIGDHPFSGLVTALAIGERGSIPNRQWDTLAATGTSHLMAISGLHIGLIAGLAFFLGRYLWTLCGRAALIVPAPQAAAALALLLAAAYAALAGFSIPTRRALIMVAAVMVALLLRRQVTPARALLLALGGVLLMDPVAVVTAGFWLSFAAVAVILYGLGGRLRGTGGWRQWGRVQWVVALGLLPLLALFFQQVPLLSPLANLLAVPWVSMAVVPLTLLGAACVLLYPPLGGWLLGLAADLLGWLWPILEWLAGLDFSRWQPGGEPSSWALAAAAIGILWMLAPRGVPARWVGGVWLLPLVVAAPQRPAPGEAWFTLLDVGQGLAAVVQTRNHTLVYDTGPKFSDRFDTGAAVVVPFLRNAGVQTVDVLMVGHGDNDHIGGAASLLRSYDVRRILSTVPERLSEGAEPCRRGESWRWDGVRFTILHPEADGTMAGNDASCVLRVESGGGALLLTGDIERRAERELLAEYPRQLAAAILVAPHHGSKSSSQRRFVAAVDPKYVLFPVGYRNRFHHPHPQVARRYREEGALLLDSASLGAIRFRLDEKGISAPESYRLSARHYWNAG